MSRRPPPLRWRLAHRFTSYSRQRGSEMARENDVTIEDGSDRHAVARVRDGPSVFVVRLEVTPRARRELKVSCTCPVFALGRDACRHVWAALVTVDRVAQRAHLARLRRAWPLRMAPSSQERREKEDRSWPESSTERK